ncbi:MAG: Xaa-Pro peptidase family protein [Thermomicrobiales bacterium]
MTHRLERARALLDNLALDAILVTDPSNRRYLSGFTADDHGANESSGYLLIDRTSAVLFGSPVNTPWAESEVVEGISVRNWKRHAADSIIDAAREGGWRRLGFEEFVTPTSVYFSLTAPGVENLEIVPIGTSVDELRAVKDAEEIGFLEHALHLTDVAFIAAEKQLRAGQTEFEFAEIVRAELRAAGSEGEAFDTIVASGLHAAKPHHSPGDRRIGEGEPVIVDMGAMYKGYNGDLTRTIWVGTPDPKLTELYAIVEEAQNSALAGIKSGVSGSQADAYCRDVFRSHGLDLYFVHSTGHGLGLRVHEAPSARQGADAILQPGEVVTVEPGLYVPGWGGVRIEDVVVVTEDGNRNLTAAPKYAPDRIT